MQFILRISEARSCPVVRNYCLKRLRGTIEQMLPKISFRFVLQGAVALGFQILAIQIQLETAIGDSVMLEQNLRKVRSLSEKEAYSDALTLLAPHLPNSNRKSAEEDRLHRSYLRLGAFLNLQLENFSESEELLRQLYRSAGYRSTVREEEHGQVITRDTLFLWNALMMQGKEPEARNLLEQEMLQAKKSKSECYFDFASYLSGRIDEKAFLENESFSREHCQHFAAASKALRHFWIAQLFSIQKNHEMARKHLILFLELSSKEDLIERGVAFRQLGIPIEKRLNFIKSGSKTDECLCALNGK